MTSQMEAGAGRLARGAAWSLATVVVLVAIAYVVLFLLILSYPFRPYGFPGAIAIFGVTAAVLGAMIVSRQPRNGVGWVLLATSFCLATSATAQVYTIRGYFVAPGSLPAVWLAAWLGSWLWAPGVALLTNFLPLLFPDSRLPGWPARILASLSAIVTIGLTVVVAIFTFPGTGPVQVGADAQITGAHSLGSFEVFGAAYSAIPVLALAAMVLLIRRLRRSSGAERQQYKWFAYACAVVVAGIAVSAVGNIFAPPSTGSVEPQDPLGQATAAIFVASILAIPIGAGIAVLRYRLYDIDIVINRTLVYGALAITITATYVAIVVGLGSLAGSAGQNNVLLSIIATAVVAVAFQPLRERLQRLANRIVYGRRATPYEVLTAFSEGVAETYAGEDVLARMARLLADATAAESAVVWIKLGDQLRPAAASPEGSEPDQAHEVVGDLLPGLGDVASVPVRHQGELLGALTVAKRRSEPLTPVESKLLEDLGLQAGLVLRNAGLAESLKLRLEDLRASRQRLVAAQDEERRRLERNLHDGAQQHLVALKVKLGLAKSLAGKDPAKTTEMLTQLESDADDALDTLRDLARGIYPPLLADKGLAAALEAQARKATLPVEVQSEGVGRYAQDVEAAVYFCVLEGLQNVQKYARAGAAIVRLGGVDGRLEFSVEDDGAGFDLATTPQGSGLQNMADRLDALGGTVRVDSTPGKGTRLGGELPAAPLHPVTPASVAG